MIGNNHFINSPDGKGALAAATLATGGTFLVPSLLAGGGVSKLMRNTKGDTAQTADPRTLAVMGYLQALNAQQQAVEEAQRQKQARKVAQRQTVEQLYADMTDVDANDRLIDARVKAQEDQAARDNVSAQNQMDYAAQSTGQAGSTVDANRRASAADAYSRMLAQWQAASATGKQSYRDSRTAGKAKLMDVVNGGDDLGTDAINGYLASLNGQLGDQAATQSALRGVDAAGRQYRDYLSQLIGDLGNGAAVGVNQYYGRQPAKRTAEPEAPSLEWV